MTIIYLAIFVCLKQLLFKGAETNISLTAIEKSPRILAALSFLDGTEAQEIVYSFISPIMRCIRFLYQILITNWYTFPVYIALVAIPESRKFLGNRKSIYLTAAGITATSTVLYSLNIFDEYLVNAYLYKYANVSLACIFGIFLGDLLHKNHVKSFVHKIVIVSFLVPIAIYFHENLVGQAPYYLGKIFTQPSEITTKKWSNDAFITKDIYDAMKWLQASAPKDSIIASDRKDIQGSNYKVGLWFGYSAYSGLAFYNEGDLYNLVGITNIKEARWNSVKEAIEAKNQKEMAMLLNKINADYLVISKNYRKRLAVDKLRETGQSVYENNEMMILKIHRAQPASSVPDTLN